MADERKKMVIFQGFAGFGRPLIILCEKGIKDLKMFPYGNII